MNSVEGKSSKHIHVSFVEMGTLHSRHYFFQIILCIRDFILHCKYVLCEKYNFCLGSISNVISRHLSHSVGAPCAVEVPYIGKPHTILGVLYLCNFHYLPYMHHYKLQLVCFLFPYFAVHIVDTLVKCNFNTS